MNSGITIEIGGIILVPTINTKIAWRPQNLSRVIAYAANVPNVKLRTVVTMATVRLLAATIVAFLFSWNEFFFALIFTNTLASKTITKAISEFSSEMGAGLDYGLVATGGILSSLPPIAIALFFQRFLVRGLTGGAVKQ